MSPWVTTVPKQWLFPLCWERDWSYWEPGCHTCHSTRGALTNAACAKRNRGLRNACWHPQHHPRPRAHRPSGAGGQKFRTNCSLSLLLQRDRRDTPLLWLPLLSTTISCSSHRGNQWNEGKSGGDLGLMRLFRGGQGHKHKNRKPITFPSNWESQPVHKLLCHVTEKKSYIRGPQLLAFLHLESSASQFLLQNSAYLWGFQMT